jgi:hypothetical protein
MKFLVFEQQECNTLSMSPPNYFNVMVSYEDILVVNITQKDFFQIEQRQFLKMKRCTGLIGRIYIKCGVEKKIYIHFQLVIFMKSYGILAEKDQYVPD